MLLPLLSQIEPYASDDVREAPAVFVRRERLRRQIAIETMPTTTTSSSLTLRMRPSESLNIHCSRHLNRVGSHTASECVDHSFEASPTRPRGIFLRQPSPSVCLPSRRQRRHQ